MHAHIFRVQQAAQLAVALALFLIVGVHIVRGKEYAPKQRVGAREHRFLSSGESEIVAAEEEHIRIIPKGSSVQTAAEERVFQ